MCLYSRHSGIGDLSVVIVIIKICITFFDYHDVHFYIIQILYDHTVCHADTCLYCKQQGTRARMAYCYLNKLILFYLILYFLFHSFLLVFFFHILTIECQLDIFAFILN